MLYKQLIFDVDDTLIDFQDTEKTVPTRLFAQEGWPLTAKAFQEDEERTRTAGMNAHLNKPIDAGQLLALLEQFLLAPAGGWRPVAASESGG